MTRLLLLPWLLPWAAGCVPDGAWRQDAPLTLTSSPLVVRPPFPLNPGKVRVELCLGLDPATWGPPVPDQDAWPVDGGIRRQTGDTLVVRATLRTAAGTAWSDPDPFFVGPHDRPDAFCFGGLPPPTMQVGGKPPRFTQLELSASQPLRITYVWWRAFAFASP